MNHTYFKQVQEIVNPSLRRKEIFMKFKEIVNNLNGNTRRRSIARVAVGTSIGVLAGAAAGILLAPKSGKEIRKDIQQGAEWSAEKAREVARKAANIFKKETDSANEKPTE
jgi:hypothetical protein